MTALARSSSFPLAPALDGSAGELVQSLTYREAYTPADAAAARSSVYDPPARRGPAADAPELFRIAAGAAWALVSIGAAGSVLIVLLLLLIRVVGWLA